MERQQREFLKVIRNNLIYPFLFLFIMVCLVLSPERGAAQFFPMPFGPFMGAPFGGFSPMPTFGGLAPMGFSSFPFASSPYSMPGSAVPGLASPYMSGPSLMPVSSPYGSPFGSLGSGIAINYGQPMYTQPAYTQPVYTQPNYTNTKPLYTEVWNRPTYTQPLYTQPAYAQPNYTQPAYAQPTYTQPAYAQPAYYGQPTYAATTPVNYGSTGYPTSTPVSYSIDPRYAQSYTNPAYSNPAYSTPAYSTPAYSTPAYSTYPQNPLYYSPLPTTTQQPTTTTTSQTSTTSTTAANASIQDLPNLSALWQGTYTLYDPNAATLTVLKEGQVTLGLTQNKNEYQINGYMTANNWEITDENKKGRVLATASYNGSQIDFISVIVKFYPDLQDDKEPTSDTVMYMWIFTGSIYNNTLQGSLNISGPDNYSRAGTITLAKKQS